MTEYLLKFDSPEEAMEFALANGYATTTEDGNGHSVTTPLLQSEEYVYTIIGEHFVPTGKTKTIRDEAGQEWEQPVLKGDKKHWVLFRDLKGALDPTPAKPYMEWASYEKDLVRRRNPDGTWVGDDPDTPEDEAWEYQDRPRPESAPNRVFL